MTAAQRRTVTVKVTREAVEITADVTDPSELTKEAERLFMATRTEEPRQQMGFGTQLSHTTPDRSYAGEPIWRYNGDKPNTA